MKKHFKQCSGDIILVNCIELVMLRKNDEVLTDLGDAAILVIVG